MRTPAYILIWNDKDVTRELSALVTSIRYTDKLDGAAGDLQLNIEDKDRLFINDWLPDVEESLSIKIGYKGAALRDCGKFWIDDINHSGNRRSGFRCTVNALSAVASTIYHKQIKTVYQSEPFEKVAKAVAGDLGYQVTGNLDGEVTDMADNNSLGFLQKTADSLGKIMKIEGETIVFYDVAALRKESHQLSISLNDVLSYNVNDAPAGRYGKCTCKWHDVGSKKVITGSYKRASGKGEAVIWEAVKSSAEAKKRAQQWIEKRTTKTKKVTLSMTGNIDLVSGIAVELTDAGQYSGRYYIDRATHNLSRGGYTTDIILRQ